MPFHFINLLFHFIIHSIPAIFHYSENKNIISHFILKVGKICHFSFLQIWSFCENCSLVILLLQKYFEIHHLFKLPVQLFSKRTYPLEERILQYEKYIWDLSSICNLTIFISPIIYAINGNGVFFFFLAW